MHYWSALSWTELWWCAGTLYLHARYGVVQRRDHLAGNLVRVAAVCKLVLLGQNHFHQEEGGPPQGDRIFVIVAHLDVIAAIDFHLPCGARSRASLGEGAFVPFGVGCLPLPGHRILCK